jgi:hypothetical protein
MKAPQKHILLGDIFHFSKKFNKKKSEKGPNLSLPVESLRLFVKNSFLQYFSK